VWDPSRGGLLEICVYVLAEFRVRIGDAGAVEVVIPIYGSLLAGDMNAVAGEGEEVGGHLTEVAGLGGFSRICPLAYARGSVWGYQDRAEWRLSLLFAEDFQRFLAKDTEAGQPSGDIG
jgi:hypothetical protein